ncbi:MAG: hypothetical protein K0R09_2103 [Clostridiales bacterium]|jgi:hypothetical protein|nr:hypothetical protein [Clostridiales bacterium]
MDIKPVKKYKSPKYPIKQAVRNNPELLKLVPERWKKSLYVNAALSSLLIFTLTSCREGEVSGKSQTEKNALVAPVFDHANGRGSFGCMSISPPSFLSEEEAFQVIQEEGKKFGISFEKEGLNIENVSIPETKYFLKPEEQVEGNKSYKDNGGVIDSSKTGDLKLDGYDSVKKIGYEFVSREDYDNWKVEEGIYSSVQDFDFLSTANLLRDGLLKNNGEASIGVFYNPMVNLSREELRIEDEDRDWEALDAKVKSMGEDELRKQVKDFLEWLKAQGIM